MIWHDARREEQTGAKAQKSYFSPPCDCQLLSGDDRAAVGLSSETIPVPLAFSAQLNEIIAQNLPTGYPLSLLLMHVTQWEQMSVAVADAVPTRRQRFHAPTGLLDQVLTSVRRVIRVRDCILVQPDVAAALILPYVDEKGIKSIHDRVYHSVSLLQAETVIPPLRQEVTIEFGISTSNSALDTGEEMLKRACHLLSQVVLKPVVPVQSWLNEDELQAWSVPSLRVVGSRRSPGIRAKGTVQAPFMHLPGQLPERLMHLIPHSVAYALRCVPVGRNHNRLTVAMADPGDALALSQLSEITGLTIFPVACEEEALDQLLERRW